MSIEEKQHVHHHCNRHSPLYGKQIIYARATLKPIEVQVNHKAMQLAQMHHHYKNKTCTLYFVLINVLTSIPRNSVSTNESISGIRSMAAGKNRSQYY